MNELFDKEVNAQKESLKKYFRGSRKLPHAHEKVCDENERNGSSARPYLMSTLDDVVMFRAWAHELRH